jgi:hypothetical protein
MYKRDLDGSAQKWRQAIRDAKAAIKKLERSIAIFKVNLRKKIPWPGESTRD